MLKNLAFKKRGVHMSNLQALFSLYGLLWAIMIWTSFWCKITFRASNFLQIFKRKITPVPENMDFLRSRSHLLWMHLSCHLPISSHHFWVGLLLLLTHLFSTYYSINQELYPPLLTTSLGQAVHGKACTENFEKTRF